MNIESILNEVARAYPAHMVKDQVSDVQRIAFNIELALNGADPKSRSICDIGGGVGLFSTGCAAIGMNVLLVDDFDDPVNHRLGAEQLVTQKKYGVRILSRDVIKSGIADLGERFDIVTTFDSMEHWHHSPKRLFSQIRESLLKPGGRFVIGVPNCVNLRKRITVPFGIGKWSTMGEWYEEETFRAHVREPDVGDLHYIAKDMRLKGVEIHGRNWLGYKSRFRFVRAGTRFADVPLRAFPSLCADIYMTGHVG